MKAISRSVYNVVGDRSRSNAVDRIEEGASKTEPGAVAGTYSDESRIWDMNMLSLLMMTFKWMSYWITRDQWGLLEKAVFCDQSTVLHLRLSHGGGDLGAMGSAFKIPITETRASEGIMCTMDAYSADAHRICSHWCHAVEFCDSWPEVNFHHFVVQCKLKQQCFPQTFPSVSVKNLTSSI